MAGWRSAAVTPSLLIAALLAGCAAAPARLAAPPALPSATPIVIVVVVTATPAPSPVPPATATSSGVATASPSTTPASAVAAPNATFQLCARSAVAVERAIAQFIGGRPFRASLSGQSGGCAQLDIHVQPAVGNITGRQSTSLSTNGVSVQIVSERGTTTVRISNT